MSRPFAPVPFETLPEAPRLPHGYGRTEGRSLELETEALPRHRVAYRTVGAGPPLLLVHGLMTSSYSFRYVFEALATRYTVFAPDLPGAGATEPVDAPYAPDALGRWLLAFQDALGLGGADCLGNSMGGYIAMHAALARPGAFRRLVNLHSPGLARGRIRLLGAALSVLPRGRALAAWLARRDPLRWAHRNVHYRDETLKSREEARAYGEPLATMAGSRAFARYLADTLATAPMRTFEATLRARRDAGESFPCPLLLLYAREDPMVPPAIGPALHALVPSATFEWLEQTSHFAHVDTPDAVVERCVRFFGG